MGVAASWNLAPDLFKEDHWLITNDDQEFQPGVLRTICETFDRAFDYDLDMFYVNEHQAYDVFGWTREGMKKHGLFDENFYPIYFEDWDMRLRLNYGHAKTFSMNENIPVKHGKINPVSAAYMEMLEKCQPINSRYFLNKWGEINDHSTPYKTPFNNKDLSLKDWAIDGYRRNQLKKFWNEYVSN